MDAETARSLSLFRPLVGVLHRASCRIHWFAPCQSSGGIGDTKGELNCTLTRTALVGYQRNSCGYCKSDNGSASYYASSVAVRPEHYEILVRRGWRRSGTLYYKQNLQRSCCPHYTMRLEASEFKARRDQRKAINRWNKYVLGQEYIQKVAMLAPKSRDEKKRAKQEFDLVKAVHASEYSSLQRPLDPKTKRPIEPAHKFEVTIEGDSVSQRKFDVFLKYQKAVHNESTDRWKTADFKRFLCSGLKRNDPKQGSDEKKLGSWHQCYRLDGRLIAVAVLDLLPDGVSSVYLFYDPEFGDWEFGKLSALREIALATEQKYKYYYMGYYIHSCQKMRYKALYRPQYILDPESMTWDPLDGELCQKLDKRSYVSLSHDRTHPDEKKDDLPELDNEEELSLFDIDMPGVMTATEVLSKIDLDHWLLLVHGTFVHMIDLVGWEDADIKDAQSVKGIVGELAAVLGEEVVRNSGCVLFD
ncbi:arginine-tRNA-protein transferase 1 [Talaromyces proteolyticus]|uniref:arginyltransferase n=1 Tax=Talaromyces proteolyticus TaxID=1131652 RepID=A0AAD4PXG0_9EURO|nr:arginine-tRNA-protein transferase 1 [Talaromyces proteolyticus]KAH8699297.1 arginine-tRNA-protein transferase 1 [Talaromyces proteolyticus]